MIGDPFVNQWNTGYVNKTLLLINIHIYLMLNDHTYMYIYIYLMIHDPKSASSVSQPIVIRLFFFPMFCNCRLLILEYSQNLPLIYLELHWPDWGKLALTITSGGPFE